jgi:myosin-7
MGAFSLHTYIDVIVLNLQMIFQDEFSVSDKVALQLAGLQAQVVLGDYQEGKGQRYKEVSQYLCKRILNYQGLDWSQQVASAHKV